MFPIPHQEQARNDKRDIDEKIARLEAYIQSDRLFPLQSADEQARLRRQLNVMHEYSEILGVRIGNFPKMLS